MLEFIVKGAALGLANSLSPGPLQLVLVRDTLRSGRRSGLTVAVSSFFADVPIVATCFFVGGLLLRDHRVQLLLSAAGALMLLRLAVQSASLRTETAPEKLSASFGDGLLATLLNPHPWAFWLLVGVPWGYDAVNKGASLAYFLSFQAAFVGLNCALVLLTHAVGAKLGLAWRPWTGRIAALLFAGMIVALLWPIV